MGAWQGLAWPGWAAAVSAVAIGVTAPEGFRAGLLLAAADDPAALSEIRLDQCLTSDPALLEREVGAALAAGDVELARSLADLAAARDARLSETTAATIAQAEQEARAPARIGGRFVHGFVTGESDDMAGLAGTVAGDLTVFGDIRDAAREGARWAAGGDADQVMLGLAAAGIAVTAGTYVSGGLAAPARLGVSVVKSAYRTGRIGAGLGHSLREGARGLVETEKAGGGIVRAAVRTGSSDTLLRLVKDAGRIRAGAGTRAAFDALKVADHPRDVARAARLAEAKGGQTRAILKVLGRGALVLGSGAFSLVGWLVGALMTLFGFAASIKAMAERLTRALFAPRAAR